MIKLPEAVCYMMISVGFSCLIEVRMWEVLICSIFNVGINYCMPELWQKQHMLSYTKVSRPTSLLKYSAVTLK